MTGFNDWIYFEPASVAAEDRFTETDSVAKRQIAASVERSIKTRIDPGVDLASAQRAQSVRVREEDGRLIIDENDHAAVLSGGTSSEKTPASATIMDLFQPSNGIPSFVEKADGSRSPVYREIKEENLFKTQQTERDEIVDNAVRHSMESEFVDSMEGATEEVNRRYPR